MSNIGTWMQMVTVPFVVYELTGSTAWLSASVAISYLPQFFISPLAGAVADRMSRRTVLICAQVVQMVASILLAVLWIRGVSSVGVVLAVVLVSNLGAGFHVICWQALVPSLVPRQDVPSAARLNSMQYMLGRAIGPAVAGFVLARFSPGTAFTVNAISFVGVLGVLFFVRLVEEPRDSSSVTVRRDLIAGVSYVRAHAVLRQAMLSTAMLTMLAYGIVQLAPALAAEHFLVDEAGYATLLAAHGIGSLAATGLLAIGGDRVLRSKLTFAGLISAAVGAVLLGVTSDLPLGAAGFFMIGLGQSTLSVSQNTALLLQVEHGYRGRVLSLYLMSNVGVVPIGSFALATLAGITGMGGSAVVAGALLGGYTVWAMQRYDALKALDSDEITPSDPLLRAEVAT